MGYIPAGGGSVEDGQVINGVAHFARPTVPFQRNDLSALVAGDRWYKPIDNGIPGTAGNWIWSGSDWITSYTVPYETNNGQSASVGAITEALIWGIGTSTVYSKGSLFAFEAPQKLYLDNVIFRKYGSGDIIANSTNYFNLYASIMGVEVLIGLINSPQALYSSNPSSLPTQKAHPVNAVVIGSNSGFSVSCISRQVVGSPSATGIRFFWTFVFRGVHP